MEKRTALGWIFLLGSAWGLTEVMAGEALYAAQAPRASVFLSVAALLILASARGLVNRPGSSTAVGAIAAAYRLINAAPFVCHVAGIFILGAAFDAAATLIVNKKKATLGRTALAGIASSYAGNAFFALLFTYIVRYGFWAAGGLGKVADHILVSGTLMALGAVIAVPLGYQAGSRIRMLSGRRPRWVLTAVLGLGLFFWAVVRI